MRIIKEKVYTEPPLISTTLIENGIRFKRNEYQDHPHEIYWQVCMNRKYHALFKNLPQIGESLKQKFTKLKDITLNVFELELKFSSITREKKLKRILNEVETKVLK